MDVDIEELAKKYVELTDEELLRMHASGQLTDVAYEVLEKKLTQRGILIPNRANELAKSIATRDQRFWSFKTWTADTAFRLILACWFSSSLAIYIPLVALALILGVEDVSAYASTLFESLPISVVLGGMNTIPFIIYLAIWGWRFRITRDKTIYTRQLVAIVYGALGIIAPTSAVFSAIYWDYWEWFSSDAKLPSDYEQTVGIVLTFVAIFVQPIGLIVGSLLGYVLGIFFERRQIRLSNKWVIIGTVGFAVFLLIGLVAAMVVWG